MGAHVEARGFKYTAEHGTLRDEIMQKGLYQEEDAVLNEERGSEERCMKTAGSDNGGEPPVC